MSGTTSAGAAPSNSMPSNGARPVVASFMDLLRNDLDNPAFCDVQLESSDGELIPCSKLALSMRSVVFADLLDYADQTVFPAPSPAWILLQLRDVCYFGTFQSLDEMTGSTNDNARKLCQLLLAMDYYQMHETLSEPIYSTICQMMNRAPRLACVAIDEFGLDSSEEVRYWFSKVVETAVAELKIYPREVLLGKKQDDDKGICSIQDAGIIQRILFQTELGLSMNVWTQFEALHVWATVSESNRGAAAELWEESEMLTRLKADDPEYFREQVDFLFVASSFGRSTDFLVLHQRAFEKNIAVLAKMNGQDDLALIVIDLLSYFLGFSLFVGLIVIRIYHRVFYGLSGGSNLEEVLSWFGFIPLSLAIAVFVSSLLWRCLGAMVGVDVVSDGVAGESPSNAS